MSVLRAAPAREADVRPGERPAHVSLGRQRDELVPPRRDDEAAERRPRRLAVAAEQPLRAVVARRPRRPSRRSRAAAPARAARRAPAAPSRPRPPRGSRRARRGRAGSAGRRDDDERDRERRERLPRAPRRLRLALRERRAHDGPASARAPRARPGSRSAPARFLTRVSFSESSPRRRRELTVPRGRPSSSAISPGVYSSRWRRTITARCSGGSAASAREQRSVERRRVCSGAATCRAARLSPRSWPRPRPVDRAVDDDPVQPGPERTAAVEAVEVPDGGEEGLLRDVLGGGGVVDDEKGGAVGARASAAGRAPRSPRRTLAAPRARRRAPRGRRPSADCTAVGAPRGPGSRAHDEAGVVGRARDADSLESRAPRALNVQSVPCESDGVKISPKPCWTL